MKHVGFTGTRYGMTDAQKVAVSGIVSAEVTADLTVAHHGDCVGADAQFHAIARERGLVVVGHIPINDEHRAFCAFDRERAPLPYMKRNAAIVAVADLMIAAPLETTEQDQGGTWRTVQLARKARRRLLIVWPDGSTEESWSFTGVTRGTYTPWIA